MISFTLRKFVQRVLLTLLALSVLLSAKLVLAHHSAALFYTMGDRITLTGEVQKFNFRNPHAIVELLVKNEAGEIIRWTCETSSPSALRRRGWNQQSISVGETVTLVGVPARDGSRLMRITSVTKADGTQVGVSARMDD